MCHKLRQDEVKSVYASFDAPLAAFDCGRKCSPHNERGVPFCCDTRHAVPTAYQAEWSYLEANTDLWHLWEDPDQGETARLRDETPEGMELIECLGHHHCQRNFRSITCRAFPFFPYIDSACKFIGLSYYWEYEQRCWVISNLDVVTYEYRQQFVQTYDILFSKDPGELNNFGYHSQIMRQVFTKRRQAIPLLHRDGYFYQIAPDDEQLNHVEPESLPKFGLYEIAALMPFPGEQ